MSFDGEELKGLYSAALKEVVGDDDSDMEPISRVPDLAGSDPGRTRDGRATARIDGEEVEVKQRLTVERVERLAAPLWRIICDFAGVSRLSDKELTQWSEAATPVAEEYLGDFLLENGGLLFLVVSTIAIAEPRYREWEQHKAETDKDIPDMAPDFK